MKPLIVLLALVSLGLGYEASNKSRLTQKLFLDPPSRYSYDGDAYLAEALAGVEAGNPFWEWSYGVNLTVGSDKFDGWEGKALVADPAAGRALVESAAEKGLTQGLTVLWMLTGRSDDTLINRALDLGDPGAVMMRLYRFLRDPDCSSDAFASFTEAFPSRETVERNRDRARTLWYQWDRPEIWGPMTDFNAVVGRSYEDALIAVDPSVLSDLCKMASTEVNVDPG